MRNVHRSLVIQLPAFLFVLLTSLTLAASPPKNDFNVSLSVPAGKSRTIPVPDPPGYRIKTIVIDAGHGGKDPGCLGSNSREKHIALGIALSFAQQLRDRYPDLRVILTRDDDTFIPLDERAAIANRAQADLFVSIHCNYMPGSQATDGSETYVMGLHTAQHNLDVAKRENESILLEEDYEKKYDYDPNSSEGHILLSLYQNVHLDQSILFASFAEQKMHEVTGRRTRGVKQAGFVVLKETTMPSVLVETGFLSSPTEEANLLSDEGQQSTAQALVAAFSDYREFVESGSVATVDSEPVAMVSSRQSAVSSAQSDGVPTEATLPSQLATNIPPATPPAKQPTTTSQENRTGTQPIAVAARWTPRTPEATASPRKESSAANIPVAPPIIIPVRNQGEIPAGVPRSAMMPAQSLRPAPPPRVPVQQTAPQRTNVAPTTTQREIAIAPTAYTPPTPSRRSGVGSPPTVAPSTYTAKAPVSQSATLESELDFAVQLAAATRKLDMHQGRWANIAEFAIAVVEEDGMYKYRVRGMQTYDEAVATLTTLRSRGFGDAFLIAHRNRQKLNQQQIKTLLGR